MSGNHCPYFECEDWCRHQPALEPSDCTGAEECPAPWHFHGCFEDGGGCTEPHEHVISAETPRQDHQLPKTKAATMPGDRLSHTPTKE